MVNFNMYSLLKHNRPIAARTRYLSRGDKLRKYQVKEICPLCTSVNPKHLIRYSPLLVNNHALLTVQNVINEDYVDLSRPSTTVAVIGLYPLSRDFHTSSRFFGSEPPLKASSKVEETVQSLKEKAKEQLKEVSPSQGKVLATTEKKKGWGRRIKDELIHYYHGFRLLFIDIHVSSKLMFRVLRGKQLTRREYKLLIRTTGDMFRLVPFSVFVVVPFLEFTLPIFLKFFPGMLPSTFETHSEREAKMRKSFKVKLEMTKFLQETLDDMALASSKNRTSTSARDFAEFFQKVRSTGGMTTSDEIMKFSKLFEDEITLDNLPRPQLMALCRVLEMNPIGTSNFLRFQLRLKLRSLMADDKMIQKEGIDSLSTGELQAACRARGMRALGVSEDRLRAQLAQWLDLSLDKKVPPSLLLLSQAFMFPETTPTEEKLAATIQALPNVVGMVTQASIGEKEGKVDYKTKIEVVKEELAKIHEERSEEQAEEAKCHQIEAEKKKEEIMVDSAPTLMGKVDPALQPIVDDIKKTTIRDQPCDDDVTAKDIQALESALENKKLLVEKEILSELRQEMVEYEEDINELKSMIRTNKEVGEVRETKAAKRLFNKLNKMITKMNKVLSKMEAECKDTSIDPKVCPTQTKTAGDILRIDELIEAIGKMQGVSKQESPSLERLSEVLNKLDADRDGLIRADIVLKMLDLVGNESVKLSKKQINELVELIDKEEALEMDLQILKALKKGDDVMELKKELDKKRAFRAECSKKQAEEAVKEGDPQEAENVAPEPTTNLQQLGKVKEGERS